MPAHNSNGGEVETTGTVQAGDSSMKRQACVAGVGESRYYKRGEAVETEFQLACTAIERVARKSVASTRKPV